MFEGSQVQNAIYGSGTAEWPISAGDWEARAQEVLDVSGVSATYVMPRLI